MLSDASTAERVMTKREAAIISAYTGILIGDYAEFHKYIEEIMKRPVFTHELGNEATFDKIKQLSKEDFCSIRIEHD